MLDGSQNRHDSSRRRAIRRAVSVVCEVISDQWEGSVFFDATNLSTMGLWLDSSLALEVGEEVIVSFVPPYWRSHCPLTALAAVVRVGMYRRRKDVYSSGMGLMFTDLETNHAKNLSKVLCGLPPPLPIKRFTQTKNHHPFQSRLISRCLQAPSREELSLRFVAEGQLLGGSLPNQPLVKSVPTSRSPRMFRNNLCSSIPLRDAA